MDTSKTGQQSSLNPISTNPNRITSQNNLEKAYEELEKEIYEIKSKL